MRNRHLFLLDLVLLAPLPFLAMALRVESFTWPPDFAQAAFAYAALALPIRLGVAHSAGIYRFLWKHASLVELERLVFAGSTSAVLTFVTGAILIRGLGLAPVRLPFSALLLDALLAAAILAIPLSLIHI